jgi:hypothetical protein
MLVRSCALRTVESHMRSMLRERHVQEGQSPKATLRMLLTHALSVCQCAFWPLLSLGACSEAMKEGEDTIAVGPQQASSRSMIDTRAPTQRYGYDQHRQLTSSTSPCVNLGERRSGILSPAPASSEGTTPMISSIGSSIAAGIRTYLNVLCGVWWTGGCVGGRVGSRVGG